MAAASEPLPPSARYDKLPVPFPGFCSIDFSNFLGITSAMNRINWKWLATYVLTSCLVPAQAVPEPEHPGLVAIYDRACLVLNSGNEIARIARESELVIVFQCSYPQSRETSFHITRFNDDGWSFPINLDESFALYKDGTSISEVTRVYSEGEAVVVMASVHDDGDPMCCPSMETKLAFFSDNFSYSRAQQMLLYGRDAVKLRPDVLQRRHRIANNMLAPSNISRTGELLNRNNQDPGMPYARQ